MIAKDRGTLDDSISAFSARIPNSYTFSCSLYFSCTEQYLVAGYQGPCGWSDFLRVLSAFWFLQKCVVSIAVFTVRADYKEFSTISDPVPVLYQFIFKGLINGRLSLWNPSFWIILVLLLDFFGNPSLIRYFILPITLLCHTWRCCSSIVSLFISSIGRSLLEMAVKMIYLTALLDSSDPIGKGTMREGIVATKWKCFQNSLFN